MAAIFNVNIASLNAQRNLDSSQGALQTSLQRLSSGLRINSARDDAAGLAISSRFTSQIRGLDQAVRNANDSISLAQTAEGSLGEITNNLQRIRELAVQASNSTNSASDRAAINQEVQQRLAEIDRTSSQTSFNGQKILDGSFGTANFQVGANAGETISVSLATSMRTDAIGKIATTTTAAAVGAASGGTLTTGALALGDFSVADATAVNASLSLMPTTLNFGDGSAATSSIALFGTASTRNFGKQAQSAFNPVFFGFEASNFATAGDFTSSGINAHFDILDDVGNTITIALEGQNYVGDAARFENDVKAILANAGSTIDFGAGEDGFAMFGTAGNTATMGFANIGSDAAALGISTGGFYIQGHVASPSSNVSFTIGGHTVNLTSDYSGDTGIANMASDLQTQLQGFDAGYTVTVDSADSNKLNISLAGSIDAADVAIAGTSVTANLAGIVNTTGTPGTASANASFTVDGKAVLLTEEFAATQDLADEISRQINTGQDIDYTVSVTDGTITIEKVGDTGAALAITGADDGATAAGLGDQTGAAGAAAVSNTAIAFSVDGNAVTLNGDYSGDSGLASFASDLGTALGSGYTVAASGSGVSITNDTAGSAAVVISDADANALAAGFANATGTAGAVGGPVVLTDFSIAVDPNSAVSLNGTYDSVDDLAAEINNRVNGVYATVSDGKLNLASSSDLTLGGTDATGSLGFASASVSAGNGSLSDSDTLTVAGSLDTIQRVDSALSAVGILRGTFGAVQNRFDSVIANLSSSSENLTAARSRIQDADFASETAALTRGQILQQAGTAMLAQANSLPYAVLDLLLQ